MSAYEYKPLREGEIRILLLLPGDEGSRLDIGLEHAKLLADAPDQGHDAQYEAVSYVWGPKENMREVFIDGAPLEITPSLNSLLRRLRSTTQARRLWADAICINQLDLIEQAAQVTMMGDIYKTAERVLVDLGEETQNTAAGLELINAFWRKHIHRGIPTPTGDLSGETFAYYLGVTMPTREEAGKFRNAELPPDRSPGWDPAVEIFEREWFRRVWIIQEFVLARDVVMFIGKRPVEWTHLLAASFTFNDGVGTMPVQQSKIQSLMYMMVWSCIGVLRRIRLMSSSEEGRRFLDSVTPQSHIWKKFQKCRLVDLLHYFQMCDATKPRDRYFSTFGMADDVRTNEKALEVDYICPIETIITRVARFLVTREYGEEMFMRAGLHRMPREGIPSWAEDVTVSKGAMAMVDRSLEDTCDNAAGGTTFVVGLSPSPDNVLKVLAFKFERVGRKPIRTLGEWNMASGPESVLYMRDWFGKAFRLLLEDTHPGQLYPTGETVYDAARKALICDQGEYKETPRQLEIGFTMWTWGAVSRNRDLPSAIQWALMRAHKLFGITFEEANFCFTKYLEHLAEVIFKKLLPAVTSRGYFAQLPSGSQPEDEIWIVRGCRQPIILCRSRERSGMYQLVGSCYVHGIMQGEALDGREFEEILIH
ncbi:uncharacterized protein E0L32_005310 [Thyridium curvatum]|uniref:Heterokaryon incompatibility domain-containing protein n=1 Tax=Thyridium curvatum TaxID=1093900 RepID=A0A507BCY2_9PEZI|nr:uncharacterized protein E0L32_005310 [Thyridium curvatum]TPX14618.1 hypothetical protein E0L32_005310 [Thyridium curvatum]